MSLRSIYSLRLFCDGDSIGKTDSSEFGFYADDFTQSNPVIIGWCESTLAPSTDGATVVDGLLARSYAPIILNVSQLTQDYDVDSPVVNNSGISITIANHEKCLMYIKSQGIELMGLKVRLSINFFNESGTLTSSAFMFYGEIQDIQMNETSFVLSCKNNKFSKESNLLNVGEVLTVGELTEQDQSYVKAIRNTNFKTTYSDGAQNSFLLIGGYDTISSTVRKRTYQVFFKSQYSTTPNLIGWWLYVDQSGTESKGEYRKITSCTYYQYTNIDASIAIAGIGTYIPLFSDGWILEIEIDGAFTEGLVVDLYTYVQFVQFNHSFLLSKNALTGTIDRLYNKTDDTISQFGDYGYSCTLNTDGTIDLEPDYPIDDDTIATYTALPCTNLSLIGLDDSSIARETTLREWVFQSGDTALSDPYKKMQLLSCKHGGSAVPGFFSEDGATISITTNDFENNGGVFDKNIATYGWFRNTYTLTVAKNILVGIQFELPAIDDDFTFKSVHIGIALKSTCANGISSPEGILCLTKQAYGTAKKHFSAPLVHTSGETQINTIPDFYLESSMYDTYFYPTDWQWKTPTTAPQTRFTNLELSKLQDVDTVEKYNNILKVGLFFPRSNGINVSDEILLHEIAVIFKHENSLTEVFV